MEFACQCRANCDNNGGKPKQNLEIGDFNEFQEDEIQRAIEEEAEEEEAAKAEQEAEEEAEHEPEEDDLDAESLLSALLPSTFADAELDNSDQDDVDAEEWKIKKNHSDQSQEKENQTLHPWDQHLQSLQKNVSEKNRRPRRQKHQQEHKHSDWVKNVH
eukprot:g51113.t1